MRPDTIILHHSLTADGRAVNWQAIRRYHTSYRCEGVIVPADTVEDARAQGFTVTPPWTDIGYHFGIERVNDDYEILLGRMPDQVGAHCVAGGMNRRSLGICFVGDFDIEPPSPAQWDLGLRLVRALMGICGIRLDRVFGHRDFDPGKSCPGMRFDVARFRREL